MLQAPSFNEDPLPVDLLLEEGEAFFLKCVPNGNSPVLQWVAPCPRIYRLLIGLLKINNTNNKQ